VSTTFSTIVIITSIVTHFIVMMFWQRVMILRAVRLPRTWRNLLIGPKT
jgi:hypothetical protein